MCSKEEYIRVFTKACKILIPGIDPMQHEPGSIKYKEADKDLKAIIKEDVDRDFMAKKKTEENGRGGYEEVDEDPDAPPK